MKDKRLDILLEHINLNCKYYLKDEGSCERSWADTDRRVLKYVGCNGFILKCELTVNDVIRRVG